MLDKKNIILGCAAYLREHPRELLRAATQARSLRFGVPVAALQWLAAHSAGKNGPWDVEIAAVPPGIRVTATVSEMDTLLRGSAVLTVHDVRFSDQELRVEVGLTDVSLRLLDDNARTPLAALIQSGALDLSRTANLVAHMPKRPAILVEAIENRLVLDFMRLPRLSTDQRLRHLVGTISTLLNVQNVSTDSTHLDVAIRAFPKGLGAIFARP